MAECLAKPLDFRRLCHVTITSSMFVEMLMRCFLHYLLTGGGSREQNARFIVVAGAGGPPPPEVMVWGEKGCFFEGFKEISVALKQNLKNLTCGAKGCSFTFITLPETRHKTKHSCMRAFEAFSVWSLVL